MFLFKREVMMCGVWLFGKKEGVVCDWREGCGLIGSCIVSISYM